MLSRPFVLLAACCLMLVTAAASVSGEDLKIENRQGFKTAMPGEQFRAYWESLKEAHKMQGRLSDFLKHDQIETIIILEVNIAIAADPKSPSLQDELLRFMTAGNHFDAGRLPDDFDKSRRPRKHLVGLFRTKKGQLGLITLYRELAVVELEGKVGVAPAKIDNAKTLSDTGKQETR
jgi:hypothetical protein